MNCSIKSRCAAPRRAFSSRRTCGGRLRCAQGNRRPLVRLERRHCPEAKAAKLEARGNITYATVTLSRKDYDQYYRGFSNAILCPTFHYRNDLARYDRQEYAGYLRVNDWLARQLIPLLQPDDLIWVHDYHLIPFAAALRNAGSRHPVGFFLHIPFPMPEILRTIPPHAALIEALCQYDVVGFQTRTDL